MNNDLPPGFNSSFHTRFRKGVSGNPKGRPPKSTPDAIVIMEDVMNAPIEYREHGVTKTATRRLLSLKKLRNRALAGDVKSAGLFLTMWLHERAHQPRTTLEITISDWLPDYPGQTAAEKTSQYAARGEAEPTQGKQSGDRSS
jgi:hypothetical protein